MRKAVTTPLGKPQKYVDLTPAEIAQREKDAAEALIPRADPREDKRSAIAAATTLEELKAAILMPGTI